ncbi:MAG: SRPBCC family protein [Chloroflexota bacterium]
MAHIVRRIQIGCTPRAAWDLLIDLDRLPDCATPFVKAHGATHRPLRIGETIRQTIRVVGRDVEVDWRVVDVKPLLEMVYQATCVTGSRLYMKQRVISTGNDCQLEVELDYQPPKQLIGKALSQTYVERRIERETACSLHNLRDLLEGDTHFVDPAGAELTQTARDTQRVSGAVHSGDAGELGDDLP